MAGPVGQIDVLGLEWSTAPNRDRVSATLVSNYLRLNGISFVDRSIWDGLHAVHSIRPALLFITNTVGAHENFIAMRYAKRRGLLGLSLISEGNFQGEDAYLSEMIWGWNTEKHLYEDLTLQWSEVTLAKTLRLHPELEGRVKVSGGVGFDNYRIGRNAAARQDFLARHGKQAYRRMIGIGCWDFGIIEKEDRRFPIYEKLFPLEQRKRFRADGLAFDRELTSLIRSRPDTLFLLKQHPGEQLGHKASGIEMAAREPNVLVLKNEEPILTCIEASDLWIVYESTTAMEAWLLGKSTALLNPSGRDFPRDRLSEGSPDFRNAEELGRMIDQFYAGQALTGFEERALRRRQLIKDVIQWDDGLNHVRAGNEILDLLQQGLRKSYQPETSEERKTRLIQHAKWVAGPFVRRNPVYRASYANRRNFDTAALASLQAVKMGEQKRFYDELGLSLKDLRQIRCIL